MTSKKYARCHSSGVEWLRQVPDHWTLRRLGYYFEERREKVSDADFPALSVTKSGIVPQLETAAKTDDGDNRKRVAVGDFVINSRSDRKGSAGVSDLDGSVSLINSVLVPRDEVQGRFVHHLLRSAVFQEEYYRFGRGIVADLWSTNYSEMRNILLAIPPPDEQQAIATFLDHETAKIDALVEEQRRLIELLKEKRQAVISQAVTKGLNPYAPMKDSGVEWLGKVPAHWVVLPLKHAVNFKSGGTPDKSRRDYWDGDVPWASAKDLKVDFLHDTADHVTETALAEGAATLVKAGTVLVVVRGMILARTFPVVTAKVGMAINQDLKAVTSRVPNRDDWLAWLLRASSVETLSRLDEAGHGTKALRMDAWGDMRIALPPCEEQERIASFLLVECERINSLVSEAERAMELLAERRSALISAAVTGKIDVRGLAERAATVTA